MSGDDFGVFPFGKCNTIRPARLVARSQAVVVGVYPSAWHIEWHVPERLRSLGRYGRAASLAVDVEPEVFWEGDGDFLDRVTTWQRGFIDGVHGTIGERQPRMNGSTGRLLRQHYLEPLGLDPARTTYTDVFPVYMVKYRRFGNERRQQGDAIREEYEPVAHALGLTPCTLKERLSNRELPAEVARAFATTLEETLIAAGAPLVITVGEEAWRTVQAINALNARSPVRRLDDLKGTLYGSRGQIVVGHAVAEWLPLIHPCWLQVKQAQAEWPMLHRRWLSSVTRR